MALRHLPSAHRLHAKQPPHSCQPHEALSIAKLSLSSECPENLVDGRQPSQHTTGAHRRLLHYDITALLSPVCAQTTAEGALGSVAACIGTWIYSNRPSTKHETRIHAPRRTEFTDYQAETFAAARRDVKNESISWQSKDGGMFAPRRSQESWIISADRLTVPHCVSTRVLGAEHRLSGPDGTQSFKRTARSGFEL